MYRTLLTCGLLLGGGIAAAELTCITCTAIESYREYKGRIRQYKAATQQPKKILHQEAPCYRSIWWNNLKETHAKILQRH